MDGGGISIAEMLHSSSLLALVGGGDHVSGLPVVSVRVQCCSTGLSHSLSWVNAPACVLAEIPPNVEYDHQHFIVHSPV